MTSAQWLTVQQVAETYNISAQTVLRYIERKIFAPEYVMQEKSRGRQGWRYLISPDARLDRPTVVKSAAPDTAPESTPYADAPVECPACVTFRLSTRGCVRALLGECECPKCQGLCECARV